MPGLASLKSANAANTTQMEKQRCFALDAKDDD
jgi:hypothetical protein